MVKEDGMARVIALLALLTLGACSHEHDFRMCIQACAHHRDPGSARNCVKSCKDIYDKQMKLDIRETGAYD